MRMLDSNEIYDGTDTAADYPEIISFIVCAWRLQDLCFLHIFVEKQYCDL